MAKIKRVIVIGASAGGLKAVAEWLSGLPRTDAAIFVVLHVSKNSMGDVIAFHLQKQTTMTCKVAVHGEEIQQGHVYIAPPDHHMIIKEDKIVINNGPHENRWRPSIDVLFRSAAVAFNSNTIGIVLSGLLDDGTSGMSAIKKSGGIAIVQEPDEAEYSDMPLNVLKNVEVDFRVPVSDMKYILQDIFAKGIKEPVSVPPEVKIEAEITEKLSSRIDDLREIASQSVLNCPDCGGGLWKVNNDVITRYRCHTGHVYTEKVLMQMQSENIEESLWVAIRILEERRNLLLTLAGTEGDFDSSGVADKKHRAEDMNIHIQKLKAILQTISLTEPND